MGLTCWLCGHTFLRLYEPHRVYLKCEVCGLTTPGWRDDDPDIARPRVLYEAPVHLRMRFRDPALGPVFSEQMMRRGVLWLPDCANVMAAHTPEIIEQVIHAADDSMAALSRED